MFDEIYQEKILIDEISYSQPGRNSYLHVVKIDDNGHVLSLNNLTEMGFEFGTVVVEHSYILWTHWVCFPRRLVANKENEVAGEILRGSREIRTRVRQHFGESGAPGCELGGRLLPRWSRLGN